MYRPRIAALLAILFVLTVATGSLGSPPGSAVPLSELTPVAAVAWPPSSGFVLAELVTGGTSASDEYVEIANAGPSTLDLNGLELVYASSSGLTITRKASWMQSRLVPAGHRYLVANALGRFASVADGTYDGGLAGTGGSLALRTIGGAPVDAVGWGDATGGFVEGIPAVAPAVGSSVERRFGGAITALVDTNDNATDWTVQAMPVPQGASWQPPAASTPTPETPTPTPEASNEPTVDPSASLTPDPSTSPTADPGSEATPTAAPSATPTPSPSSTPSPTPSPTASPTPSPSPSPTDWPSDSLPPLLSIAAARATPLDVPVQVRGVVTAELGTLGSSHLIAIADSTAGIIVHLPGDAPAIRRGDAILAAGTLAQPYGQLELRVDSGDVAIQGVGGQPAPIPVAAATVGEGLEGRLVVVEGRLEATVRTTTTGLSLTIADDDDDVIRVVAGLVGLSAASFPDDQRLRVTGIVGQRATGKGRLDGYRIWLRDPRDVQALGPLPVDDDTATPDPSPSARPAAHVSISAALRAGRELIEVEGVVTTPPGFLDTARRRVVIDDGTGAVALLLPVSTTVALGERVRVTGTMGTVQGAPRLETRSVERRGFASGPDPIELSDPPQVEMEWRLVRVEGDIDQLVRLGDRWHAELIVDGASFAISSLTASGVPASSVAEGHTATVTGIVRRPAPTASDQRFLITPRSISDVVLGPAVSTDEGRSSSGGVRPSSSGSSQSGRSRSRAAASEVSAPAGSRPSFAVTSVDGASLGAHPGERVLVGGEVVSLDGKAMTLNDSTARIRVELDGRAAEYMSLIEVGDIIAVTGRVEQAGAGYLVRVADTDTVERAPALGVVAAAESGPGAGDESSASDALNVDTVLPSDPAASSAGSPRSAALAAHVLGEPLPALAGLGSIVGLLVLSFAVTLVRRRRLERALAARIATRLQAIVEGPRAGDGQDM